MQLEPFIAALLAFMLAASIIEITASIRSKNRLLNGITVFIIFAVSVSLSGVFSRDPEAAGGDIAFLWMTYAVVKLIAYLLKRRQQK